MLKASTTFLTLPGITSAIYDLSVVETGYSPIPFEQLISVYDKSIWILILVTIVGMASLFGKQDLLHQRHFLGAPHYLLVSLKIFLEQGDSVFERRALRFGCGFYILLGIVISNAYKNTNVI